ncbi:MAG: D-hexose-6-phosphate mutarotase [Rhodoferax sp.]|nr:D-hexose-6-phosphate mutarotase [Rhodoferax sp.]
MSDSGALSTTEVFQGQACVRLHHASGDSALVALHGGHVLSWTAGGVERFYLSPKAVMDGKAAIRGGVPICFPQFNQRGPLVKHGFARNLPWTAEGARHDGDATVAAFGLASDAFTRAMWPHDFVARLAVRLSAGGLQLDVSVDNTGAAPLEFTLALHSYFRVAVIGDVRLGGLEGRSVWDSLTDTRATQTGPVHFTQEFDAVYQAAPGSLALTDGQATLHIAQSPSFGQTVVWNPGAALCAKLADMPADGWQHMVCVEAAQIDTPVPLAAGAHWAGWQRLTVGG